MVGGYEIIDFASVTSSGERCLGRLADIALLDSDNASPEWMIISSITSVEEHTNHLLTSLIESSGVDSHPFGIALLTERIDDIYRTWESRLAWLKAGFNIAIAGDREIQEFICLVDLRNALVHGNGELTTVQTRRFDKMLELRRRLASLLGVEFDGLRVILNKQVASRSIAIARVAVLYLDSVVLEAFPTLSVRLGS